MKFISTRGEANKASASEAILQGLAPDGGLYVPEQLPPLDPKALDPGLSYPETARRVLHPFFEGDVLEAELPMLCDSAFSFPVPLRYLEEEKAVLELFHGPTAAFKDFGARFLAYSMEHLQREAEEELTILVATSGDTGGAVAAAFFKRRGIKVRVLFPEGRVSARQHKQLTCWGENVQSYSVRGSFDDCQRLVKEAFVSSEVRKIHRLSSANSINLGRLLPQVAYYVYAAARFLDRTGKKPVVVIPSGNVGNSMGAYYAAAMGAPIARIVLAVNANRVIPDYLDSGTYRPRPSVATLANAMDVGDPSNMERLRHHFSNFQDFKNHVSAISVSDEEIRESIRLTDRQYSYPLCPHTAAGEHVRRTRLTGEPSIVVATAHPAKFETIVEPIIHREVEVPENLAALLDSESRYSSIDPELEQLFPELV
ncbi:MAG TPA: threonine synthase [Sediminispirochaeta sp.]|nr:threonine synthase [Sediminispirochaeta sp.]